MGSVSLFKTRRIFQNVSDGVNLGGFQGVKTVNIGRWGKVLGSGEGGYRMSLGVEMRGLNVDGGSGGLREVGANGCLGCSQRSGGVNRRGASGGVAHLGHGLAQGSDIMRWNGVEKGVKEV